MLTRAGQRLWWLVRNPVENGSRLRERVEARRTGWRPETVYAPNPAWESRLHKMLDAPWPCPEHQLLADAFKESVAFLEGQGLTVGREAYGGWDDADLGLVRAAWCLVRHLEPHRVVETGVGRGITSRLLLQALARNSAGHLWSIDQQPPLSPRLKRQVGAAVPETLRARWSFIPGSSRRRLPPLVSELGDVDVFIHDSMHSTRNVRFELETVWPAIRPGGVMLVGDINMNRGFELFVAGAARGHETFVGTSDDGDEMIGVARKGAEGSAAQP
jgi:hypothetical protein